MSVSICHCFSSSQSALYFLNGQVQYMQANGFTVSFAVPDDGFIDDLKVMFPHVNIHIVPIVRHISLLNDFKALFSYLRLFKKQRFDIIHLHTPKAGLLGAIAARLLFHRHIIFHLHGLVSLKWDKLKPGLTLSMEKIPLKLAHQVLCVSKSLQQLCIDNHLVSPEKISTLEHGSINGIDYENKFNPKNFESKTQQLKDEYQTHDKFVVGFLGRMNEDKGLSDIIEVVNNLSQRIPNLFVIFVGPNEMDVDINQYFDNALNMPYQYFPRTHQPEHFISLFNVMIFPSYREGFGLVAAEANALEVPVVAYNIAGIRDAIEDNETGQLVDSGIIKELMNAVDFYYKNQRIMNLHGVNGRNRVMRYFTPQKLWQAQLHFYRALLGQ